MERAKPKKNIGPGTAKTVAQAKLVKAPKCGVAMPKASSRSSSFDEPRWLLAVIEQHRKPPSLSLLLLPFRQPARRVIRLAVQLLHLFHKADRKSTRLNSSHLGISYAVFCLKKKK